MGNKPQQANSSDVIQVRYDKLAALREQISGFDARIVIDGHWTPYTKEELLAELV